MATKSSSAKQSTNQSKSDRAVSYNEFKESGRESSLWNRPLYQAIRTARVSGSLDVRLVSRSRAGEASG